MTLPSNPIDDSEERSPNYSTLRVISPDHQLFRANNTPENVYTLEFFEKPKTKKT